MAWTPLKPRLGALPLVLAGPVLRRTTPDMVSVWIALKESRNITLKISNLDGSLRFASSEAQQLLQFGPHLYIGCITARSTGASTNLEAGHIYLYDLDFGTGEGLNDVLNSSEYNFPYGLGYAGLALPSFVLPGNTLDQLRFAQGSCRKPHGGGPDALVALDNLISSNTTTPIARPQFLIMSGDQIYADDVADSLLYMLRDAVDALLDGWDENIPGIGVVSQYIPGNRADVMTRLGFTAAVPGKPEAAKSHLMSFGEYLMMYLFAWSDVFWGDAPPFYTDVTGKSPTTTAVWGTSNREWGSEGQVRTKGYYRYIAELEKLAPYRNNLWAVRRVLANIPSYMMFDDHEITDDWYISKKWCERVVGADDSGAVNFAGRRIVANGLGAFAICQSWGNDPELFSEEGASAYHLIRELATWSTSKGTAEFDVIENRLLPPSGHVTQANGTLMQPLHPVRWNFNINVFSAFNLYVADTRTQRQFRSGDIGFPSLISEENLLYQFPNASIDFVVVVLPAPYFGFPANENLQASRSTEESRLDLDCEAASLDLTFFEQLLSTFAKMCPVSATDISKRSGRFLICSGDVHYAYGAQARYKAKRPFETEAPGFGVDMVLIQATASAMKNESDFPPNTFTTILGILEDRVGSVPLPASGLPEPVLIYGYNESGSATEAARKVLSDFAQSEEGRKAADVFRPIPWVVWVRKSTGSVRIDASNVTASFLSRMPEPDWQYQIRFLEDLRTATERNVSSIRGGREAVGHNNIEEIAFQGDEVVLTLWWWPDWPVDPLPKPATKMIGSMKL